jgi:hypothetical protein
LADAGVNVVIIAEVLGHSDIRTTRRYSHALEEAKREAVEKPASAKPARQTSVTRAGKEKRRGRNPAAGA